jgi:predicted aldo/keto reductase-like oxidoreductase
MDRRDMIRTAAGAVAAAAVVGGNGSAAEESIPRRPLGRTGEQVSIIGLGGFHIGMQKDEQESIGIIRAAIDAGITFMDNCWDYNKGTSEVRMGKALRDGYRQRVFLMTKIDGRDAKTAMSQLEESLQRLQTDHVDLIQLHEVIHEDDPERAFAQGGAIEGLVRAREQGKARFIGFTGHKSPRIHKRMIETADAHGFRFDTVQMPLNVMDAHFDSFEKVVLPMALERDMGVLGMKALGDPFILQSHTVSATEALRYAMSLPVSTTITGIDSMAILQQDLGVARGFRPLNPDEKVALLEQTKQAAVAGEFEQYKTSTHFDGTTQNPQWLG